MTTIFIYGVIFLLEALIAFQYFECMFYGARYNSWKRMFIIFGGYAFMFGCFQLNILILNMITFPVINFIIIRYIYKQDWLTAIFQSIILAVIMNLAEMLVVAVFSGISGKLWDPAKGKVTVLFLGILSKFLYFLVTFIISRFKQKKRTNVQLGIQGWIFLIIPVCILTVVLLLNYMCFFGDINKNEEDIIFWCLIICLVIIVITFVIFGYLQRVYNDNIAKTLQLQREECDVAYYKAMLKQDETQKIMIHDIKKHISTIYDLMINNDYESARNYMDRLYTSKNLMETIRFSENRAVNVILNRYVSKFIEAGIHYNFDIRSGCMDYISVDDITVLLCNMLDNAYEGMAMIDNASVDLRINMQGSGTVITMTNDCKPESALLKSQKTDRKFHGYGIKSIKRVAKRYNGDVELYFSNQDNRFHTIVYLNNKI